MNLEELFNKTYDDKWEHFLYSICMKYTSDIDQAKDWCQIGFIKAHNNLHKFKNTGNFASWISRIIRNTIIDDLRKNKNVYNMEDKVWENLPAEAEDDTAFDRASQLFEIQEAAKLLSPQYKLVFEKYYTHGLKHSEIADDIGISIGTSKSNLSKAKQRVRELINS